MRLMRFLPAGLALLLVVPFGLPNGDSDHLPPFVPEVALGFSIAPVMALPAPTALAFGPDLVSSADGPDLYATTLTGHVVRVDLAWTAAGPVNKGVSLVASGFSQPLGLIFGDLDAASPAGALAGPLFVADSHSGSESDRIDGRITRLDIVAAGTAGATATRTVVVDGLPNGRHNTNHLRYGSDGLLYVANGNPNDNGRDGGDPDIFPLSGAVLRLDATTVSLSPAVLHWEDENGAPIPDGQIATHPRNLDFSAKVDSFAYGFRNIFGVAEHDGHWYTATNGADDPSSQDTLYKITEDADHGFPFCYDVGPAGGVGAEITTVNNPIFPAASCADKPVATALLGWHTCTTGLDFPTTGPWQFPSAMHDSVFVAECATFFAQDWFIQSLMDPDNASHNLSHKVVRVPVDEDGDAIEVQDFVTGLSLPTDVLFGPDGSMFIADADGVFRVAPLVPEP